MKQSKNFDKGQPSSLDYAIYCNELEKEPSSSPYAMEILQA